MSKLDNFPRDPKVFSSTDLYQMVRFMFLSMFYVSKEEFLSSVFVGRTLVAGAVDFFFVLCTKIGGLLLEVVLDLTFSASQVQISEIDNTRKIICLFLGVRIPFFPQCFLHFYCNLDPFAQLVVIEEEEVYM